MLRSLPETRERRSSRASVDRGEVPLEMRSSRPEPLVRLVATFAELAPELGVALHTPERGDELVDRAVGQTSPALLDDLPNRAVVVGDHRRPLRECLETDEAEGLVGERGNEHGDGVRVESA